MSRQSHKPCPPFFLSLQKQLSMRLPPLATQAPSSHIFRFYFLQRPPAPVADASTSLPLLAAQADQALQPFSPNITNHAACSRSKREAASACNTGPHILFTLLLLTPFSFSVAASSQADASVRLPQPAVQDTQDLQDVSTPIPIPRPSAAEASSRLPLLTTQALTCLFPCYS